MCLTLSRRTIKGSGLPKRTTRIGRGNSSERMAVSPGLGRVCSGMGFWMLGRWRGFSRDSSRRADWRELIYLLGLAHLRIVVVVVRGRSRGWHGELRRFREGMQLPLPLLLPSPLRCLALIGARSYTGQALTTLLSDHPYSISYTSLHGSFQVIHWNRIPRLLSIV